MICNVPGKATEAKEHNKNTIHINDHHNDKNSPKCYKKKNTSKQQDHLYKHRILTTESAAINLYSLIKEKI